jgi:hypothetical protein
MRAHISLIAALFLATGEALAYPPNYYDCGYAFLKTLMSKGSAASGNRVFSHDLDYPGQLGKTGSEELGVS